MKVVDLNVLLYAINRDMPRHEDALLFWESALNGDEPIGLPWVVVLGFLRLATNAVVMPRPLDAEAAIARVDAWLATGVVRVLREKDEHWEILRSLLGSLGCAGNVTTDAHLAALAISHGAVLVSFDNDFSRFPSLRWESPPPAA
jgi:toxin-antitoxin system PIN domain toxin